MQRRKRQDASSTDPVVSEIGKRGSHKAGHVSYAYTIIPTADGLRFFAVEIEDVSFKKARILEPSGDAESRGYSAERLMHEIMERTFSNRAPGWHSKHAFDGKL